MEFAKIRTFGVQIAAGAALVAALGGGVFGHTGQASAQDASFGSGQDVIIDTTNLNFRSDATVDADIIETLYDGTWATIVDGPVSADGYDWYEIDIDGSTGWVDGEFLSDSSASISLLPVGTDLVVTGDSVNLRDAAGLSSNVVDTLSAGDSATVLSGPESSDDVSWYEVSVNGETGYVARTYLAYAAGSVDSLAEGDSAMVNTDSLTLRDAARLDGGTVASLEGGTGVVIVSGPEVVDGYSWFNVETDSGSGWVAGDFLVEV